MAVLSSKVRTPVSPGSYVWMPTSVEGSGSILLEMATITPETVTSLPIYESSMLEIRISSATAAALNGVANVSIKNAVTITEAITFFVFISPLPFLYGLLLIYAYGIDLCKLNIKYFL